jgi:hypothetical protein
MLRNYQIRVPWQTNFVVMFVFLLYFGTYVKEDIAASKIRVRIKICEQCLTRESQMKTLKL